MQDNNYSCDDDITHTVVCPVFQFYPQKQIMLKEWGSQAPIPTTACSFTGLKVTKSTLVMYSYMYMYTIVVRLSWNHN